MKPSRWDVVRIKDIGRVVTGRTPPEAHPEYFGSAIPFITPTDMDGRRIIDRPIRWLSPVGAEALDRILIPKGVGVSCIGWQMGKSVLILTPSVTNQQINTIIPNEDLVDVRFLYYAMSARRAELFQLGAGGSRTPILKKSDFENVCLGLPPLSTQRAVAALLGALDDKIELNRRMNETLEAMAQALFRSWFVDFDPVRAKAEGRLPAGMDAETAGLFPDGFTDSELGEIPQGWRVAAIGDVVRAMGGATPSTANPAYWDGTISFATPKDLASLSSPVLLDTERRITEAGLRQISSGLLPAGTVLMSSRAPIGYLAITEIPVAVNQGFIAMVCDGELPNYYVLNWAQHYMDAIIANANGTTFLEISKANFRPLPVAVPSANVLDAFTKLASPYYRRIAANLRESRTLAAIRDALLPKLMSGEIRVPDTVGGAS